MKAMLVLFVFLLLLAGSALFAFDALAFADRAFSGQGTLEEKEHSFTVINETFPGTTKVNCMQDGKNPIRLAGKTYRHGLGVHADSHVLFDFSKPVVRFTSHVGIDSLMNGSPAEITWQVLADGKEVAAGDAKGDNTFKKVDAALPGIKRLELILDHGKEHTCDQTDWGNARVYFEDGTEAYLDEIAGASRAVYRYPFSFVYGGVSSDELLPGWKLDKKSEALPGDHVVNTYTYTGDRLTVKAVVNIYTDTQALDWTLYFTGTGNVRSKMLKDINALNVDWRLSASAPVGEEALPTGLIMEPVKDEKQELTDVVLCRTGGTIGCVRFSFDEFKQKAERLPKGETVSTVHGGTASSGGDYSPWWSLKWADGGMVCGMGWTGTWRADYTCDGENLNVKAGFGDAFNAYLKPGETARSARIMSVFFTGDDIQTGMNLFRRSMINHVSPKHNGKAAEIPIAYTVSASE
ncbi:MAG: NPCBM/NEW2 domain-containing protein, partial [Abditibacteriota bacterium]|nr:NPCBM/NEW2 domain-containing protein [Abditibacteriota bacterium]